MRKDALAKSNQSEEAIEVYHLLYSVYISLGRPVHGLLESFGPSRANGAGPCSVGVVTIISVLYGFLSLAKPQAATMINPPLAFLTEPLGAGAHNSPSK